MNDNTQFNASIKPNVSLNDVREIIKDSYGLNSSSITELNGYDDKNYKVNVTEKSSNIHIRRICKDGYVLKILNNMDSRNISLVEGQNSLMMFLANNGISCPKPVKTVHGNYYIMKHCSSGNHVVRLLEFIPGIILYEMECSTDLFYKVGKYVANLDLILKKFHHPAYDNRKSIWMLESVPYLSTIIDVIMDNNRRDMVNSILDEFKNRVLHSQSGFQKGMIHGDFNEHNIIMNKLNGEWFVHSVLDIGDSQYSCYLYELAITVAYMIIVSKDINIGGHVVAGFCSILPISQKELDLLKICVSARLCQSLVIGAYTSTQYPDNSYLLSTAATGWQVLTQLYNESENIVLRKWNDILESYSK